MRETANPVPPQLSDDALRAALAAAQEELIACQRLATLGSIAAMVVHEYNNLLTPVLARVEAALMLDDQAFARRALEQTLTNARRATSLAQQLMELAQGRSLPVTSCVVSDVVQRAIATIARPFEKDGIDLQVTVPPDLTVRAQEDLLCQVLVNLLLNARKAMKNGGRLRITAVANPSYVQIEVRDAGVGIPGDDLEKRFNPFLAASPFAQPHDWRDVGLGLAVCRLIAHQHGARLVMEANEGPGCTVRITWPRADAQREHAAAS